MHIVFLRFGSCLFSEAEMGSERQRRAGDQDPGRDRPSGLRWARCSSVRAPSLHFDVGAQCCPLHNSLHGHFPKAVIAPPSPTGVVCVTASAADAFQCCDGWALCCGLSLTGVPEGATVWWSSDRTAGETSPSSSKDTLGEHSPSPLARGVLAKQEFTGSGDCPSTRHRPDGLQKQSPCSQATLYCETVT